MSTLTCLRCHLELPDHEFSQRARATGRRYRASWCRDCMRVYNGRLSQRKQPAPRWTPWTPWPSSCLDVPQLDSGPLLPTRGAAHGHVHHASKRRVHRRATGDSQGGNS